MAIDDDSPTSVDETTGRAAEERVGRRADHLVVVVGYDGSEAARHAVDASARLIAGRSGTIEIVFVAQLSVGAGMVPQTQPGMMEGLADTALALEADVRTLLDGIEPRWRFQRRDGSAAHELIARADELSRDYAGDASVVVVVGSAGHAYHRVIGSVPVALVRHAKYPVVVVP